MCLCQWNHALRVHDFVGKIFRAQERIENGPIPVDGSPRILTTAFVLSSWWFVIVWLYEQKWAEAKKPIHRFLNRVPLQMSSRRKQQMMPLFDWSLSWLSLRKRIVLNAGKFRFVHRHPDNLSLSNFSISRRSIDRSDSRNDITA